MPDPNPALGVAANDQATSPGGTKGIHGKRRYLLERTIFHIEQLEGDFLQMPQNEDGTGPKYHYLFDLDVRENSRALNRMLDQLKRTLDQVKSGRLA